MVKSEFSLQGRRVWVAGHRGMVGAALVRRLAREACTLLTVDRSQLDLRRQAEVEAWMERERPDVVFIAAATVGGIHANDSFPARFLYDNLAIETNIIHAAQRIGVAKLVFLGSSCIYPRLAEQPMREDALLTGPLEPTNQWYAVAKIAGIKLCQAYRREYGCDYISAMPTNLYGPGDNFHPQNSHVAAALIARFARAAQDGQEEISIWGSGSPRREFLYVDDLADGLVFLLRHYSGEEHVNIGTGSDVTIRELAEMLARISGWQGRLVFDRSRPDGAPQKLMDNSRIAAMGWQPAIPLERGLQTAYDWFRQNQDHIRR
ncbi:GDP-L-fucose synthase [Ferrovibrio sp.]|uniref:GDP-L-fucose synthase n=1 Tax=Ferrovibrio sp. TaxID=1917215 RepID=UPI003D0E8F09